MTEHILKEEHWSFNHDLPVGEILRRTREQYGQTLEQVEFAVRIRASQLYALEIGDIEQLPGRVYAIGFVRTYSEYLGLDGDQMVHLFKTQAVGNKDKTDLSFPIIDRETQLPTPPMVWGGLVGGILLIIFWLVVYGQPTNQIDQIPELEDDIAATMTEAPPIGIEPTVTKEGGEQSYLVPTKTPDRDGLMEGVVIRATEKSWVQIRAPGQRAVVSRIFQEGEEFVVPDDEGLRLTTGNAGGLEIFVDGQKIQALGKSAQVKRNVSLDRENLLLLP